MEFTNLHLHTEFSALDGMIRLDQLAKKLKSMGQKTLCITDHGTCSGYIKAKTIAKENGLKFIPGIEAYQVQDRTITKRGVQKNRHLIMFAKNEQGYRNLIKMNFEAFTSGRFMIYDRLIGRCDFELLEKYGKGLVATSACFVGWIPVLLREGEMDEAIKVAKKYQRVFDDFFFEVQAHNMEGQKEMNDQIFDLSLDLGIPAVATTDAHYLNKEDNETHDVLLAVQAKEAVGDPDRKLVFGTDELYVKSIEEVSEYFGKDIIANTQKIANMCDDATYLETEGTKIPKFKTKEADDYQDFAIWLKKKYEKSGVIKDKS